MRRSGIIFYTAVVTALSVLSSCCTPVFAQGADGGIVSYTTSDGLSDGTIKTIFEDSRGYMWFGTFNGANKFDGYEFINYLSGANDPATLSHRQVNAIAEDKTGRLWFGTNAGINLYNFDQDNFIRVTLTWQDRPVPLAEVLHLVVDPSNTLWVLSNAALYRVNLSAAPGLPEVLAVGAVYEAKAAFGAAGLKFKHLADDASGNLWLASSGPVLSCLRTRENTFETVRLTPPGNALRDGSLDFLTYDPYNDAIVISTASFGLIVYSIAGKTFEYFNEANTKGLHNNLFLPYIAAKDTFYLPTDGKGLIVFDYRNKACLDAARRPGNLPLPDANLNSITRVFRDSKGNYWLGSSNNTSIKLYAPSRHKFRSHSRHPNRVNTLSNNLVMGFYQDAQENLWICTDGGGLNRYTPRTGEFRHFFAASDALPTNKTLSVTSDKAGNLWLASWDGGISKLSATGDVLYNYLDHCTPAEKERYNWPFQVLNDSEDHLWIAFLKGGLGYYDKQTNRIYSYACSRGEKGGFISDYVTYLYEDSRKNIWVCTYNGLAYFNLREVDFSASRPDIRFHSVLPGKNAGGIAGSEISSIAEDKNGTYWIGHINHGLDRFDLDKNTFRNYSTRDGLPGNATKGLVCDRHNDLWVFTNKGAARLRPRDGSVSRFDANDGLLSKSIVGRPYLNPQGEIFVGSIHGFNHFDPARMNQPPGYPRPQITGLKIYGEPVKAGAEVNGSVVLPRHISNLREIELSHRQDFIALKYLAIAYSMPEKIQYRYMLESYDLNWVDAGNKREATYRNLSPGTYTFRVKASNSEGAWNGTPAELKITVLPPWWNTWWFRIPLTLCIGA